MGQKYGLDFKTELLSVFFVKNMRRGWAGWLLQFFFSTMILGIFQSHGPPGFAYDYHTDQNFIEKKNTILYNNQRKLVPSSPKKPNHPCWPQHVAVGVLRLQIEMREMKGKSDTLIRFIAHAINASEGSY